MPESFHLSVLTPTESLLEEPVESIIVPGSEGYLGVLAHHAPLITALKPGKLTVRKAGEKARIYALSGGFLEVSNNRAILLADSLETPESIDLARARRSAERARKRLQESSEAWDRERCQAALERAENRLRIAQES